MSETWFIADTHFGHENCWKKFKRADGSPLRPFSSTEEMDNTIVERWNAVVHPKDTVWHLGDVVMHQRNMPTILRCNGHKNLVMGNHDPGSYECLKYFEELYATYAFANIILSHVPIRKEQIIDRWLGNAHGHLHDKIIDDPKYVCVSVEQTDYTPINLDTLVERFKEKKKECCGYGV